MRKSDNILFVDAAFAASHEPNNQYFVGDSMTELKFLGELRERENGYKYDLPNTALRKATRRKPSRCGNRGKEGEITIGWTSSIRNDEISKSEGYGTCDTCGKA